MKGCGVLMAETIEKSPLELDFASLRGRTFTPSPAAWEDQVLYFLLLDRFSDGQEKGGYRDGEGRPASDGVTPLYRPEDPGRVDYDTWFRAGGGWQGGTLRGLRSKRRGPARHGLLDGGTHVPRRGGRVSLHLLVRPEVGLRTSALADRGAQGRAAGGAHDAAAGRLRRLPGGSRPSPPRPQRAPRREALATTPLSGK